MEGSPTAAARPDGISVLAVFEVIVALVGLYVARDLAYWSNWGFSYDNFREGVVDGAMALAYLATSITGFVVAWRLWSMRASAWWTAVVLNTALLGLILVGIVLWGVETTDLIGIPVNLGVLWYLNQNRGSGPVRPPSDELHAEPRLTVLETGPLSGSSRTRSR